MAERAIGAYIVEESIGRGGFGEVLRARHAVLGTAVAIKVLHDGSNPAAVARFLDEAKTVARLSHPNIIDILDVGMVDGRYFHVMPLLRGRTLGAELRSRTRLPLGDALPILRAVASALDAAHAAGVVHRDLKPDNVFLCDDGRVILIDFGLAKLVGASPVTATGAPFGTPAYMSPEQCRGNATDGATDAYAFGALAFHVLAGKPPFSGDALEVALAHLETPPPRARVSPAVDATLRALLDKDPARRPRSLSDAADALVSRRRGRTPMVVLAGVAAAALAAAGWHARTLAPRYAARTLPIRLDGNAWVLAFDGDAVLYLDASGNRHRLDLATLTVAPAPPEGSAAPHDAGLGHAMLSPDGKQLAGFAREGLVLVDVATSARRLLVPAPTTEISTLQWTPEGDRLVWWSPDASDTLTRITNVADGTTRFLALPFPDHYTLVLPAVPLRDHRVMYCAADHTLRVRDLDDATGVTDRTITRLGESDAGCTFHRSPDGRVVIAAGTTVPHPAVLDLAAARPEVRVLDTGRARRVVAVSDAGEIVTAADADPPELATWRAETPYLTPLARCGGETSVTHRGAELIRVEAGATRVELRDGACRSIGAWDLPDAARTVVRCTSSTCFAVRGVATANELWQLAGPEPRLLATLPQPREVRFAPAVSPDGSRVALLTGNPERIAIVEVATGAVSYLDPGYAGESRLQALVWDSPASILASGVNLPDVYAVVRYALDGVRTPVWSSAFTWFSMADIAGGRVAGVATNVQLELLVVEPDGG